MSEDITTENVFADNTLSFTENWRESLPEDIRSAPALGNFKDLPSLVKSYVHANQLTGLNDLNVVPILKPDSPDTLKAEVRNRMGIPESADKYEIDLGDIPQGANLNVERLAGFKQDAFDLGLTPAIAQELARREFQRNLELSKQSEADAAKQAQDDYDAGVAKLKEEWGGAYDNNLALAQNAAKTFDPDGVLSELGLDNHPGVIKMLANIGAKVAPDKVPIGGVGAGEKTAAQILFPNMA